MDHRLSMSQMILDPLSKEVLGRALQQISRIFYDLVISFINSRLAKLPILPFATCIFALIEKFK